MKVIIAGSRFITDKEAVKHAIELSKFDITEVVSGNARGVDVVGEAIAEEMGIPIKRFLPDWGKHEKAAGPIRNSEMVKYADALIAVTAKTPGTCDTITKALNSDLKVYIYYYFM